MPSGPKHHNRLPVGATNPLGLAVVILRRQFPVQEKQFRVGLRSNTSALGHKTFFGFSPMFALPRKRTFSSTNGMSAKCQWPRVPTPPADCANLRTSRAEVSYGFQTLYCLCHSRNVILPKGHC